MEPENYISITDLCSYYSIDYGFIYSLRDYGLVELVVVEDTEAISHDEVENLEKMLRLHQDLEINIDGLYAVILLLEQIHDLQQEVKMLKNKLNVE